jgi:hypothetical protein
MTTIPTRNVSDVALVYIYARDGTQETGQGRGKGRTAGKTTFELLQQRREGLEQLMFYTHEDRHLEEDFT